RTGYRNRFPLQFAAVQHLIEAEPIHRPEVTRRKRRYTRQTLPELDLSHHAPLPSVSCSLLPSGKRHETPTKELVAGRGYRLLEYIDHGQFGEVWRAQAPGGIEVAVKIITRPLENAQRQREQQALEAIKGLRHPFLLQTQAYWSQPDQLLIVMELAESCLR